MIPKYASSHSNWAVNSKTAVKLITRPRERNHRCRYSSKSDLGLKVLKNGVVSMGRRNTRPKSYVQVFQWLDSFASVNSK